jgi:hypothetical protein
LPLSPSRNLLLYSHAMFITTYPETDYSSPHPHSISNLFFISYQNDLSSRPLITADEVLEEWSNSGESLGAFPDIVKYHHLTEQFAMMRIIPTAEIFRYSTVYNISALQKII